MNRSIDIRSKSFGQTEALTRVDRFGVWLSAYQIHRWIPSFENLNLGDFGCGFHARFTQTVLQKVKSAVLIDVALSEKFKTLSNVRAIEGTLPSALLGVPTKSLNVILCMSVLEHLWDPLPTLKEFKRILVPGGVCLLNVPSWRGKWFLEFSAFRLQLSPKSEMDDHKMYYDVKDFWPLLVQSGFKPSLTRCFKHKFGMNTFAICQEDK